VLDPLYDLYFVRPGGGLACFQDVSSNWAWYRQQVSKTYNYNMDYNYTSANYTNWDKIPVIMPAIKGILNVTIGRKAADAVSLRSLFLRKFRCLLVLFLVAESLVIAYTARKLFKQRKGLKMPLSYVHIEPTIITSDRHLVA
jgi:hypothetical protein